MVSLDFILLLVILLQLWRATVREASVAGLISDERLQEPTDHPSAQCVFGCRNTRDMSQQLERRFRQVY